MSARAEPRLTRDADLAVAVTDDQDAETLVRDLRAAGYPALQLHSSQPQWHSLADWRALCQIPATLVLVNNLASER